MAPSVSSFIPIGERVPYPLSTSKVPILLSSLNPGAKSIFPLFIVKCNSGLSKFLFKKPKVSFIINLLAEKKAPSGPVLSELTDVKLLLPV